MKALLILIFLTTLYCSPSLGQCLNVTESSTDVNCYSGTDGTVTLTPTSGQAPYTYIWNTGTITVGTGYTITNLTAGAYSITVEDNLGCDKITTIIIAEPSTSLVAGANITSNYNGSDVSCFGSCDGSITVSASGGTTPYTYTWATGATTSINTGVCAGPYAVTVTDANGCIAIATGTVTNPSALSAAIGSSNNVTCNGACDGSATAIGSGGTGSSYIYQWGPSAGHNTTATATNLCAGIHCLTITDVNGCEAMACVTITEPAAIIGNITTNTGISCNGAATGSLTATPLNGQAPYTYVWSPGGVITSTISGLVAGTYCVTVTDFIGCEWVACATLVDPPLLTVNATNVVDATCNGTCDGSFTVVANGGPAPYVYSIDGGLTFTATSAYSNLCPGQYIFQAKNTNNCIAIDTVVIGNPVPISLLITGQDTICQGATGNLQAIVSNGVGIYAFEWSNGSINGQTTYNTSGSYCVTVTDGNLCTVTDCINVDALNFEVGITNTIVSGNQKYGIAQQGNPQAIQTTSSYPNETTYNWSPATGLSCTSCPNPTPTPTVVTQYILDATHNSLGCTSSDTVTVYPYSTDTITIELAPDSTISYCSNNFPPFITGASSTGIGPLSYGSITYGLLNCFDYTSNGSVQQGIDTLLWIDCATVNIGVLPVQICDTTVIYLSTATCVWPGDTDNDGVANNFDLLPIGQHYGTLGTTRTNASNNYTCQPSLDWGTTILGMPTVDLKHVDADGNAIINSNDTNAIILNWAQTHLKNNNNFLTGIDLYVDTTTATPGDTVRLPIILGTTAVPNGYGIAFTVNYDPAGIDTSTVTIDFNNSWLGTINTDMIGIQKDFYYQGQTEVALTRINQTAVTGSGAIAHINFTIKDDVLPKSAFLRLDFDITNIRLIDPSGTLIPVTGVPTQILVTDGFTGIEAIGSNFKNDLSVFPNPTTGTLQIQSLVEEIESVFIYNLTGTLLYQRENLHTLNASLDLNRLPTGIYMAKVLSKKGMQTLRIIKQ